MLDTRVRRIPAAPMTILIIDDSPEDREAARMFLTEAGVGEGLDIAFIEAQSGATGLTAYRAQPPDCILLDYYLPDMDGLDFLSRLTAGPNEIPVPIVMLTGSMDRMLASAALRAGAQEYLPKRFMGPEMLLRAVQSSRNRFDLLVERRRAQTALAASEKLLRLSQEAGGIASFELDHRTRLIRWAADSQTMLGFDAAQEVITVADWNNAFDRADAIRIGEHRHATVAEHRSRTVFEGHFRRPDTGAIRQLECRVSIEYDAAGEPAIEHAAVMDVTDQRAVSNAMARMNDELDARVRDRTMALVEEGRRLATTKSMLHQAQKMEAVGQLTGGIAHDFNNLLHAILGSVELAHIRIERLAAKDHGASRQALTSVAGLLEAALKAGGSATQMIRRLLAFARRQTLRPVELDVGTLINGMSDMIQRALGATISVEIVLNAEPLLALADPNQLEAAILNLVINARDAMPKGGRLRIETADVSLSEAETIPLGDFAPGNYVMLKVSDDGIGIRLDVIDRVFEPFFTTKEVGQGTGLGLAMVYGFVKQSKGTVRLDSEPGKGTAVTMFLPRAPGLPQTVILPSRQSTANAEPPMRSNPAMINAAISGSSGRLLEASSYSAA